MKYDKQTALSLNWLKPDWSTAYTLEREIADRLPVSKYMNTQQDTRPVHLYFNRDIPKMCHTSLMKAELDDLPRNVLYCTGWSELTDKINLRPKSICFHVGELVHTSAVEIVNMVNTLAKLIGMEETISVTLGVDKETKYQLVKDLQKSNIFGIMPTTISFGADETIKALQAQWNNIPYWPKHILDQLDGAKKPISKSKIGEIKLTPRQEQILYLIRERGSSNKVIAKTLNITESTVKLHVGLVLKKFGVKNRTQLAVFSKK